MPPYPRTLSEALELLRRHYGTREIVDLATSAGINKATLYGWAENPKGVVKAPARRHLDRIFGPDFFAGAEPPPAGLDDRVAQIERTIAALTRIRHDEPARIEQMVGAPAPLGDNDRELLSQVVMALTSHDEAARQELRKALARLHAEEHPPRPQRRRAHG